MPAEPMDVDGDNSSDEENDSEEEELVVRLVVFTEKRYRQLQTGKFVKNDNDSEAFILRQSEVKTSIASFKAVLPSHLEANAQKAAIAVDSGSVLPQTLLREELFLTIAPCERSVVTSAVAKALYNGALLGLQHLKTATTLFSKGIKGKDAKCDAAKKLRLSFWRKVWKWVAWIHEMRRRLTGMHTPLQSHM